jgi:hypothetical protein
VYEPANSPIVGQGEFEGIGTIRIVDSLVARNYVPANGGGIHMEEHGTLEVVNSTIEDNTTEADGAGIYTNGGRVTIDGTTVRDNIAHANGGGYYSNGATSSIGLRSKVTITDSKFTTNVAWASAGAIHSGGDGEMVVTDVEIKDNQAKEDAGGGMEVGDRSGLLLPGYEREAATVRVLVQGRAHAAGAAGAHQLDGVRPHLEQPAPDDRYGGHRVLRLRLPRVDGDVPGAGDVRTRRKPRLPGARRDGERHRPRPGLQQPREGHGQPAADGADVWFLTGRLR